MTQWLVNAQSHHVVLVSSIWTRQSRLAKLGKEPKVKLPGQTQSINEVHSKVDVRFHHVYRSSRTPCWPRHYSHQSPYIPALCRFQHFHRMSAKDYDYADLKQAITCYSQEMHGYTLELWNEAMKKAKERAAKSGRTNIVPDALNRPSQKEEK
ncbi:hypothetical protein AcV5_008030 [Taiwanofungus camphoratus]|nr:hypothetical protein AcV5_008030 [Antrodia cinnamomea]KAI0930802.1 hypothetical protein AcV7_004886 [Antrodia cinnamomea]